MEWNVAGGAYNYYVGCNQNMEYLSSVGPTQFVVMLRPALCSLPSALLKSDIFGHCKLSQSTVFNLKVADNVHCEEERIANRGISRHTYTFFF